MRKVLQGWTLFSALSAAAMLWMLWNALDAVTSSLDWRLVHDTPLLQYTASMILKGYLPYRDIIEINLPFTYWIHMAEIVLFGDGDLSFRIFDLVWTLVCCGLIALLCWRETRVLGITAAAAFLVVHVSNGASSMGQRDFFMVPFLLGATFFTLRAGTQTNRRWLAWLLAGLCLGCAMAIKPIAILFASLLALAVAIDENWNKKRLLPEFSLFAVGMAVPLLASIGWLVYHGIWGEFWDVMTNLVAAIYTGVESSDWFEKSGILASCVAAVSLITYFGHAGEAWKRRHLVLQAGLAYGLLHYLLQRKGFWYNLYPIHAFAACALASSLQGFFMRLRGEGKLLLGLALFGGCAYASPIGLLSPSKLYAADWLMPYYRQLDENVLAAKTQVLTDFPQLRGETFQWRIHFFDFSVGALWAYAYREGWQPVSRFQHPYPFYMATGNPAMQRYREEMLKGLSQNPPHIILVSKQSWPLADGSVYHVIEGRDGNKDISGFFKQHYQQVYSNGMYRIYTLVNPDKSVEKKKAPPAKSKRAL